MPVYVKIEYQNVAVLDSGVTAEERAGWLTVVDKDNKPVGKFSLSKLEHWWVGAVRKDEKDESF